MTATMQTLEEALDANLEEPTTPEARERWEIDGPATAAWAMRKVKARHAERAQILDAAQADIDAAQAHIARVQAWADAESERLLEAAAYLTGHLERYALRLREEDPKRAAAVKLPDGEIVTRQGQPAWDVDEAEALKWAGTMAPLLVRVTQPAPKTSFALDKAKKALTVLDGIGVVFLYSPVADPGVLVVTDEGVVDSTTGTVVGEVVPGIRVTPGTVKATVVPDLDGTL